MVERLEPFLVSVPAWLLAGAAFHTAVASAGRRPRLAVVAALRGGVALLVAVVLFHWLGPGGDWVRVVSAIGAMVVSVVALRLLWERRGQARPEDGRPESHAWTWLWLAGADLVALVTAIVSRPWPDWLGLFVVLPALVGVPAGLAVAAWRMGGALARAEKRKRAALARVLAFSYAGLPLAFLVTLGVSDYNYPLLVAAALCVLVGVAPLATILLGGWQAQMASPEPDLARLGSDTNLLLGLAVAGLLWACLAHVDRCPGELAVVDRLPDDWPATPIVAKGVESGWLGRFRFRGIAHRHHDCGYRMHAFERFAPDYYSRAALHDPDLCFSGSVSLDARFNPFDLALHHSDGSDVFVVSRAAESAFEPTARQPIVAFRHDFGWRWRFDPPWSGWFIGLGGLALTVALGMGRRGARRARVDSGQKRAAQFFRWQVRLLLLAATLPWALEGYRAATDLPTPGHELRAHKFCRYW